VIANAMGERGFTTHQDAVRALAGCTFAPATFTKRFVRDVRGLVGPLSVKQAAVVEKLVHRYRKQLADDKRRVRQGGAT